MQHNDLVAGLDGNAPGNEGHGIAGAWDESNVSLEPLHLMLVCHSKCLWKECSDLVHLLCVVLKAPGRCLCFQRSDSHLLGASQQWPSPFVAPGKASTKRAGKGTRSRHHASKSVHSQKCMTKLMPKHTSQNTPQTKTHKESNLRCSGTQLEPSHHQNHETVIACTPFCDLPNLEMTLVLLLSGFDSARSAWLAPFF